ncbi:MAG: 16S rRNA (cytidine(1402)-2'-O)-methyltransferase [Zymomonas mobilis subsp. pomaceae]|uniref:Ribosomal RNA small subunit methyltransferase I n=1 Tax=Zymomonas mobilis subsp. pomaceae (strain ATCC 29192 / DSM 22645 / JCM 10191 / CCUG 17912 / NBRC 13757 / NCIMB 11200 / NRRL B-4491 / Barker I) TaxID=579138 RepID=F8EV26_ZYMMT|nr:16S rRNA (cytidine(1402)-2'-O)-methyltransferase [Zymomonas mobilis]AEI38244.1 Uroporphyrin-III C/tetrapyrrole (Corrin/Porphyrin) methyltransferase [Zymomonas mobilis subsp. pomaceae ATCC 29192]MDX5947933.1 16S rRNA (cytidine(1402)-2'-O)-methyltransferase [Zymomonas mobilis subsp. pomaceae]GEB89262.1 ribosomal RNA small subunit methyltransferase I [Zymomonas mobilis subsp. pomaceae]
MTLPDQDMPLNAQADKLRPGLYIVATPIGNLSDLSLRAVDTLKRADLLAVEDSRVTAKLLHHVGIKRPMIAYHDHNADYVRPQLLSRLNQEVIVLVSDAGTPLISDPGFKLVRDARAAGAFITTIPGPCAAIAALTLSGLPSDRFMFIGFLPPKEGAKKTAIEEVAAVSATLIFYETGPRLVATLTALQQGLGDREAAVVREITKKFEECQTEKLSELIIRYQEKSPKGEIVLIVSPPEKKAQADKVEVDTLLKAALEDHPVGKAAALVAKKTGLSRQLLYDQAMQLRQRSQK